MRWTVQNVPYYNDPAPRVGADETGLTHASSLVNATAWGSEIEMLRVLRAVADLVGAELPEVARAHRELSLVEIGQMYSVAREAVLDVVIIALHAGEPIAGLWHQRAELRQKAEQLADKKPRMARRSPQHPSQQGDSPSDRRAKKSPTRRGPDSDGHLDTRA